jgi:hypothetical protein
VIEKCYTRLFALIRRMALVALVAPLSGAAQEACDSGVVFGFFNGVQTTEQDAKFAAHRHLAELYGLATPKGNPITTYGLFYNDTQGFADFVETFDQRLQEHGGLLAGRFELFFSAARGEGFWWKALTLAIPSLVQFLDDLFDLSRAALMRELTAHLGDPNMGEVAARHREQIDLWASQQKKMLFFAHSQGNLFVNRAYAHAASKSEGKDVKVVHVAPASPTLSGAHTLADKDMVINGLRLIGAVVSNTTEIPPYMSRPPGLNGQGDLIGHGLLEIYLNPALATAGRIREHVMTALRELDALPRKPMPPFPDFVPDPWAQPEPARTYRQGAVSHSLDSVIFQRSTPWIWKRVAGLEHRNVYFSNVDADEYIDGDTYRGWERVDYVGKGMGGFQLCETGYFPIAPWEGNFHFTHCLFSRVPINWFLPRPSDEPEELRAHRALPAGSVVKLTRETYNDVQIAGKNDGVVFLSFNSRQDLETWFEAQRNYRTYGALGSSYYSTEPYLDEGQVWENRDEYEAWNASKLRHDAQEQLRYQRYLEERADYEEKRRRCAASSA